MLRTFTIATLLCVFGCKHAEPALALPLEDPAVRAAHISETIAQEHVEEARREAAQLLSDEPASPHAVFLSACLALSDNKLDEAQKLTNKLTTLTSNRDETKVLSALIASRLSDSAPTSWFKQYVAAWIAAGYPDFQNEFLLPNPDSGVLPVFSNPASLPDQTRAILALSDWHIDPAEYAWLADFIQHSDDEALILAFADSARGKGVEEKYRSIAAQIIDRAQAAHPDNLSFILAALESEGEDTRHPNAFAPQDIPLLRTIVSATVAREKPFGEVVSRAEQLLRAAKVPQPRQRAFQFGVRTLNPGLHVLQARVNATYGLRQGIDDPLLSQALLHAGELMASQPTLVERMVGLRAVQLGAERLREFGKMHDAGETNDRLQQASFFFARAAPTSWPIPALQDDLWQQKLNDESDALAQLVPSVPHDARPR